MNTQASKLYMKWLTGKPCVCGKPITNAAVIDGVPVGLCKACVEREDLDLAKVGMLQLAAFSRLRQSMPTEKEVKLEVVGGGVKVSVEPEPVQDDYSSPYLAGLVTMARRIRKEPPYKWMDARKWTNLLAIAKEFEKRVREVIR